MDELIQDIGNLILKSEDLAESNWDFTSIVFDVSEGNIANSGFKYQDKRVSPIIADIEENPLAIDNKVYAFQAAVENKFGHKFKQLLIQIEKETGRIKIDFEFDNANRWTIVPSRLKEMREELRPKFD
jgi:hypothetical protein